MFQCLHPGLHGTDPFPRTVSLILEDRLAPVAARHHVVERAGTPNADAPCHGAPLSVQRAAIVKK